MKIYDITHTLENNMIAYCKEEEIEIRGLWTVKENGYNVTEVRLNTHIGTHIDMPRHIFDDGKSLDDFSVDKFIGKAYILDFRNEKEISKKAIIKKVKNIEEYRYLIFKTGAEKIWGKREYLNNYITFSKDAIDFLGSLEELYGIGIDAISIDEVENEELKNHKGILGKDKIIIENLCSLEKIDGEYEIIIAPLKIGRADGAPARVLLRR
ncbi:MAG: cyclase family protein [Clostridium sp.]